MATEENYLTELLTEKDNLDPSFVHSMRLLTEGKWRMRSEILPLRSVTEGWSMEDSNICIPSRSITTGCS